MESGRRSTAGTRCSTVATDNLLTRPSPYSACRSFHAERGAELWVIRALFWTLRPYFRRDPVAPMLLIGKCRQYSKKPERVNCHRQDSLAIACVCRLSKTSW